MQKENLFKLMATIKKGEHKAKWQLEHEIEIFYYNLRHDAKQSQER